MSQGALFTTPGLGKATFISAELDRHGQERRLYQLNPPLTQPVQTSHVMLTGTSITYAQAWNSEHGAGIYVSAPTQGDDQVALERLGYEVQP